MINRRIVIKQLFFAAGGIIVLRSCADNPKVRSIRYRNFKITPDQQSLLAEVTGTIIPATDTAGAKELGLHAFVLKMVDDCMDEPSRKRFLEGLQQINDCSIKVSGSPFSRAGHNERIEVFRKIAENDKPSDHLSYFLEETKRLTLLGYLNSEYVMTRLLPYKLVPGHFYGCVKSKFNHT